MKFKSKEAKDKKKAFKLHGMTPLNLKRMKSNKKWPIFVSWHSKTIMKYHLLPTLLIMIMIMMIMRALL